MSKRNEPAKRPIPHFAAEDAERDFWRTHDKVEYFDYNRER